MGPQQDSKLFARSQAVPQPTSRRPRTRLCLLAGCEKPFRPGRPQARYCSDACRSQARAWRVWRAQRKYRATDRGRQQRRIQSKRHRQKTAEARRSSCAPSPGEQREGHPPGEIPRHPCDRPGCYALFMPNRRSPLQHFCSRPCREALRRVIQRERRWGLAARGGSPDPPRACAATLNEAVDPAGDDLPIWRDHDGASREGRSFRFPFDGGPS